MLARQGAAAVSSQDVIYRLEVYGRRPRDPAPTGQEAAHQPKVSGEPPWGPAPSHPGLGWQAAPAARQCYPRGPSVSAAPRLG